NAEIGQHFGRKIIGTQVRREAELHVGFDRVAPGLLQSIGANLVAESDAATLLAQVDDHAAAGAGDLVERALELLPAVALERAEHLARPAFGMHAAQDRRGIADVAPDYGDVFRFIMAVAVYNDPETAVPGGNFGLCVPGKCHARSPGRSKL